MPESDPKFLSEHLSWPRRLHSSSPGLCCPLRRGHRLKVHSRGSPGAPQGHKEMGKDEHGGHTAPRTLSCKSLQTLECWLAFRHCQDLGELKTVSGSFCNHVTGFTHLTLTGLQGRGLDSKVHHSFTPDSDTFLRPL